MIDIEKIAKRLVPEENLVITHTALGGTCCMEYSLER